MATNRSPKESGIPPAPAESTGEPNPSADMCNAPDLSPEVLARIRAENAHLEEGFKPTASLFPWMDI